MPYGKYKTKSSSRSKMKAKKGMAPYPRGKKMKARKKPSKRY